MSLQIRPQSSQHIIFYIFFGIISITLMTYYLSTTLLHPTTGRQFPISSFERFPLTWLIFPAEVFSFLFSIYFVYNLVQGNEPQHKNPPSATGKNARKIRKSKVAILIPVYNEPKDVVERTLQACSSLRWPAGKQIYLLDDSSNESDRQNMKSLAQKYSARLLRRESRIGYKAGNLNNAMENYVKEDYFAIFDSDQAPEKEFLEHTMYYFQDKDVGFVQVPQHFINNTTPLERAAELGTNIFFRAQSVSKSKDGAMPFCGTNAVIRSDVFRKIRGFRYYTATEDIELGIRINEAGYHGVYVPRILVHGFAPKDYKAYSSQQYRWANGNLAILRESWLKILLGRFSFKYQIHTFFTLGWWVIGIVSLLYILVPILSLFLGGTHHTWLPTMLLGLLFLNVVLGIGMIYVALHKRLESDRVSITDAFLQYSLITNSMFIYAKAAINALFKRYTGFVRTSKHAKSSGVGLIIPNLVLATFCFAFSIYALYKANTVTGIEGLRTYVPVSLWLLFYTIILSSSILFVGKSYVKHTHKAEHKQIVEQTTGKKKSMRASGQLSASKNSRG